MLRTLCLGLVVCLTPLLAGAGTPPDPQGRDQQRCINGLNRHLGSVSKAQALQIGSCLESHAEGRLVGSVEGCLTADPKGLVSRASERTFATAARLCTNPPGFGASDPAAVNGAATEKDLDMVHDLFGADLDSGVLVNSSTSRSDARCQAAIWDSLSSCQEVRLRRFNRCKRRGLRSGFILGPDELELCLDVLPAGPLDRVCDVPDGIREHIVEGRCNGTDSDLASLFPGCGAADPAGLAACLDQTVRCRVCTAVNRADGLARDCDEFDDGVLNTSCGEPCGESFPACDGTCPEPGDVCQDLAKGGGAKSACVCAPPPGKGGGVVAAVSFHCLGVEQRPEGAASSFSCRVDGIVQEASGAETPPRAPGGAVEVAQDSDSSATNHDDGVALNSASLSLRPFDACATASGSVLDAVVEGTHLADPEGFGVADVEFRFSYEADLGLETPERSETGPVISTPPWLELLGLDASSFEVGRDGKVTGTSLGLTVAPVADRDGEDRYRVAGTYVVPGQLYYGPGVRNVVNTALLAGVEVSDVALEESRIVAGLLPSARSGHLSYEIVSRDPELSFRFAAVSEDAPEAETSGVESP